MDLSLYKNGYINIDFSGRNKHLERFVEDENFSEVSRSKTINDVQGLKNILSTYGFEENPDAYQLLSDIVTKSSYRLLGLCITSLLLEQLTCLYGDKEEASKSMIETIYNLLGRHMNKIMLDKISGTLQKNTDKLLTPINNNLYV